MQVNLKDYTYNITIEKGSLESLSAHLKTVYSGEKVAVVSDSHVAPLYGERVISLLKAGGFDAKLFVIEAGEQSKRMNTVLTLCSEMLGFGLNRGHFILALGGGVVGDITGFVASILYRGVPYAQIPTSLLAQVDSSIGGKVAVDLPEGKNLVGSFYHPRFVLIDPTVLKTLPREFLIDGMAEVVKYGAILDGPLFEKLSKEVTLDGFDAFAEEVIERCLAIKKAVVEEDERDTGRRMLLNFGHTVGHGVEKCFNYETYTHGQAVAMGMAVACEIGEKTGKTPKGTSEKMKEVLQKFGLHTSLPPLDKSVLLAALSGDKKNIGRELHLILLDEIGAADIVPMSIEALEKLI